MIPTKSSQKLILTTGWCQIEISVICGWTEFGWDMSSTQLETPVGSVTSAATSMLVTDVGDEMC